MAKEKPVIDRETEEEKMINTILADDIFFNGTLKFTTSLKIKGKFEGEIDAKGHLVIGKNASVKANIKARKVTIYGKVKGNIEASELIELYNNAELEGDITTPDLIIESGCKFNGNCKMTAKEIKESKQTEQVKEIIKDKKNEKKQ